MILSVSGESIFNVVVLIQLAHSIQNKDKMERKYSEISEVPNPKTVNEKKPKLSLIETQGNAKDRPKSGMIESKPITVGPSQMSFASADQIESLDRKPHYLAQPIQDAKSSNCRQQTNSANASMPGTPNSEKSH